MDVVYVHKRKNTDEILWSVKSLKNLEHGRVFIVGDDPEVANTTVVRQINTPWANKSKYYDQIAKYLTACDTPDISEEFIAMNDDFFILEEWQVVNYSNGTLEDFIIRRKNNSEYTKSLRNTVEYLESLGLPTINFELHTPFLYNKTKLKKLIENLPLKKYPSLQLRSIYGNMYSVTTESRTDVKNPSNISGMAIVSTGKYTYNTDLGKQIRSKLCE